MSSRANQREKTTAERLSFYHPTPLPYRRLKAEVLAGGTDAANLCVLMDLTWCRFNREGCYDGGGRFLEMVSVSQTRVKEDA